MRKKRQTARKVRFCPTQKDIADALGVAQSTVAMALSPQHEHKLMVETVERIRNYAAKVGYHPQRFAQIMQGGHTRIIGVIVRLGIYTKNHEMVAILANELNRAGYRLVLVDPVWFGGDYDAVRKYLLDQGVEGVVFCNVTLASEANALQSQLPASLPLFALQSSVECGPSLREDLRDAYYHMTRLHLALGSRRLSLLSMFRDPGHLGQPAWTVRDRALGFAQAIQEAGGVVVADAAVRELMEIPGCRAPSRGSHKITGTIVHPEKTGAVRNAYENAYHQALRMIETRALPESVICANDDAAIGVLAACADRGVKVPAQVRVSGHDDTMAGQFASVPVTTIRPPLQAMIEKAAKSIVSRIQNPEEEEAADRDLSLMPCEILVTTSVGSPEEIEHLAAAGFFQTGKELHFEWAPAKSRLHRLGAGAVETSPPKASHATKT